MAYKCFKTTGEFVPTGTSAKIIAKRMIDTNIKKKMKVVPQRGWKVENFLAFSTVRSSPAANVEIDLCSAP